MADPSPSRFKHALCLFPYTRHLSGINFFPPTGLEYVAGALKDVVERVSLVDLAVDPVIRSGEDAARFVREQGVDIVCASMNWDYKADKAVEVLKALPEDVMLVLGGQTATTYTEELFKDLPQLDLIVRGEGEETVRDIVAGRPVAEIPGLSYRGNGSVVHNPHRPLPPAADLPNPDRSLRRALYRIEMLDVPLLSGTFDAVLGSRGCPFRCKFCTFSLNPLGQRRMYSSRPVASVLEELETVEAEYVLFSDDYFFAEPERTTALCRGIVERGLQKHFIANARIEVARRPEMLEAARAAGVKILLIGIESATNRILKAMNKGFTTDKVRESMRVLRRFGFFNHGYFIYGNLGETEEEMMRIPAFAREIGLDSITLSKLRAEKFSPIHEEVAKTPGAWVGSSGFVYQEGFDRKALKRIGSAMRNAFYTPDQVVRIVRKAVSLDLLDPFTLLRLTALAPFLALASARRVLRHALRARKSRASAGAAALPPQER